MYKKRKDSYFGLHFDIHMTENSVVGSEFDGGVLENILREVKPDYVQCDSKGHPGYSCYLTKAGAHPQIHTDILRKWREITAKYSIPLYAHHSGIFDTVASKQHPEWAAVDEDGKITEMMSVFGEYADKRLIPQLKEIALEYRLNGAWVDGECWATLCDYSEKAAAAYRNATGKEPARLGEDGYREFQDFCRAAFYKYAEHYITEVKKAAPDFEITSNWLNTAHAPDDVNITDFISGDLSASHCIDAARYDARIAADYGRPWDIMSWGFSYPVLYMKPAVQLCQEAACIISLGGGFQIYNQQNDKRILKHEWIAPVLKEVAEFCRARESFCHKAKSVHEAAIVYSREAFYDKFAYKERLFVPGGDFADGARGMINAALESQISMEIILTHTALARDLSEYNLLIVPNAAAVEPELKAKLIGFAQNGGALVLCGPDTAALFAEEAGVTVKEKITNDPILQVSSDVNQIDVRQPYAVVKPKKGTRVLDTMEMFAAGEYCANPPTKVERRGRIPAVLRRKYGRGSITCVTFDIGLGYLKDRTAQLRDLFARACSDTGLKLKVSGSHYADISLMKKNGREYIHLVNTAGESRSDKVKTFDEIPPLYNIKVEYKCGRRPKNVTLLPENKPLTFSYNEKTGKIKFTVKKLEIHSAVEIIY